MATQTYTAIHPVTPTKVREVYSGYSWSTFFWGPFPALFRGDLAGAGIGLLVWAVAAVFTLGWGGLIGTAIWAGFYNENHAQRLARGGYVLTPFGPLRNQLPREKSASTQKWEDRLTSGLPENTL